MLFMLVLSGCRSVPPQTALAPADSIPTIGKIAVLPFQNMSRIYGELRSVRCALCGSVFDTGPVEEEGPQVMTELLSTYLGEHYSQVRVISARQAKGELSSIMSSTEKDRQLERDVVLMLGRRLSVDAVVVGHLFRYVDRIGTNLGIERPASVAFDIDLVHIATGRLLWTARFEETQQSLLENVFAFKSFFNRGGRWLTAAELGRSGLGQVMDDFPITP